MEEEFHMKTMMGVEINNPLAFFHIQHISNEYKYTWAEKRKDRLVYKMKRIKSLVIKFILFPLTLIISCLLITGILFLMSNTRSEFNAIMCGVLIAEIILLTFFALAEITQMSVYSFSVKHKGTIY